MFTESLLQKICEFLGIEREQSMLKLVAQQTTFEMMRTREKKLGWENPVWPRDKPFMRSGKIGSFHDEMPKQALEAFTKLQCGR